MAQDYIKLEDIFVKKDTNFLIVEDDIQLIDLLEEIVDSLGFDGKIFKCENLKSAIKHLDSTKVDFIICDWGLPDGEGINLLSAIRKSPKYSKIPFMMITAKSDVDSMLEASRLKTSDYLVKPFSSQEFREKIIDSFEQE